jgi:hypothetical protein
LQVDRQRTGIEQPKFTAAPPTAPVTSGRAVVPVVSVRTAAPVTAAPPTAPELETAREAAPRPRLHRFEGDAAIKDLRSRLSRDPNLALQPPIRAGETSAGRWMGGWSFALIMVAIAAGTVLMVSPLGEVFRAESSARPAAAVTSQKGPMEEPLALGRSLAAAPGTDQFVDSQLVAPGWMLQRDEPPEALPEPASPSEPVRSLDPETLAVLKHFLKNGDIVSARILLKRAAVNGIGQAALELGMTYDPIVLAERGVRGFPPDPAEARSWYQRATALGSAEASWNLERLKSMGK